MNEVLVFKAVDTNENTYCEYQLFWTLDCRSDCLACPHGAFPFPNQDPNAPSRESIDVRLLVMYADIVYPESKPWSG